MLKMNWRGWGGGWVGGVYGYEGEGGVRSRWRGEKEHDINFEASLRLSLPPAPLLFLSLLVVKSHCFNMSKISGPRGQWQLKATTVCQPQYCTVPMHFIVCPPPPPPSHFPFEIFFVVSRVKLKKQKQIKCACVILLNCCVPLLAFSPS